MKSGAKRIVESMETSRDRVAATAFPCAMPNNEHTLNSSGSVASQQLVEDIISLSRADKHPSIVRNVKELVVVAIRKLKSIPSDPARYSRADSSVHLFLLNFSSR